MLDVKDLEDKISGFDSKAICAIIVTSKYFGNNPDTIRLCMLALSSRRDAGEDFDFETYISEEFGKLPQPETTQEFDIKDIAKNFGNFL